MTSQLCPLRNYKNIIHDNENSNTNTTGTKHSPSLVVSCIDLGRVRYLDHHVMSSTCCGSLSFTTSLCRCAHTHFARTFNRTSYFFDSQHETQNTRNRYNNMSTQQCWNDMQFCRVCARDVAFISPPPDTIARVLRDSIRERNECLKKYHTTYRQQQHESLQEMNERRCQCPNGEYVNANGTIFYCDGPRILRVLNWDTCIELGSRCTATKLKISSECLMRLSFGE